MRRVFRGPRPRAWVGGSGDRDGQSTESVEGVSEGARPRPGSVDLDAEFAAAADEAGGGVQQPVAQSLGFGLGQLGFVIGSTLTSTATCYPTNSPYALMLRGFRSAESAELTTQRSQSRAICRVSACRTRPAASRPGQPRSRRLLQPATTRHETTKALSPGEGLRRNAFLSSGGRI
jgi:hypothetical protein